jgi:hypothetical protein
MQKTVGDGSYFPALPDTDFGEDNFSESPFLLWKSAAPYQST